MNENKTFLIKTNRHKCINTDNRIVYIKVLTEFQTGANHGSQTVIRSVGVGSDQCETMFFTGNFVM